MYSSITGMRGIVQEYDHDDCTIKVSCLEISCMSPLDIHDSHFRQAFLGDTTHMGL